MSFEKTFENPSIIRLEQNYRSTKRILNCASHLINNNKNRYGKNLWSDNNTGDKVEIRGFWETKEEAKNISDQIEDLIRKKVSLNEIAILMRDYGFCVDQPCKPRITAQQLASSGLLY